MELFANFEEIVNYYGLKPKKMKVYHLGESENAVTVWQKGKASLHFLKDKIAAEPKHQNVSRVSYDGTPKAAYQIALNIMHDDDLKAKFKEMGVTI